MQTSHTDPLALLGALGTLRGEAGIGSFEVDVAEGQVMNAVLPQMVVEVDRVRSRSKPTPLLAQAAVLWPDDVVLNQLHRAKRVARRAVEAFCTIVSTTTSTPVHTSITHTTNAAVAQSAAEAVAAVAGARALGLIETAEQYTCALQAAVKSQLQSILDVLAAESAGSAAAGVQGVQGVHVSQDDDDTNDGHRCLSAEARCVFAVVPLLQVGTEHRWINPRAVPSDVDLVKRLCNRLLAWLHSVVATAAPAPAPSPAPAPAPAPEPAAQCAGTSEGAKRCGS